MRKSDIALLTTRLWTFLLALTLSRFLVACCTILYTLILLNGNIDVKLHVCVHAIIYEFIAILPRDLEKFYKNLLSVGNIVLELQILSALKLQLQETSPILV